MVDAQARSYGCTAEVDWMEAESPYYPPTVNERGAFDFANDVAVRWAAVPASWLGNYSRKQYPSFMHHANLKL